MNYYGPVIADVALEEMDFFWVTNHYDFHLTGLCRHEGNLCWFELAMYGDDEYDGTLWLYGDDYEPGRRYQKNSFRYNVHSLSLWQKAYWLARKKAFEICVGYHWSYDRRGCRFDHWLPRPLRKVTHFLYFRKWPKRLSGDSI